MSEIKSIEVTGELTVWGFGDRDDPFHNPIHIELCGTRTLQVAIKMNLEDAKLMARAIGSAITLVENELRGPPPDPVLAGVKTDQEAANDPCIS